MAPKIVVSYSDVLIILLYFNSAIRTNSNIISYGYTAVIPYYPKITTAPDCAIFTYYNTIAVPYNTQSQMVNQTTSARAKSIIPSNNVFLQFDAL